MNARWIKKQDAVSRMQRAAKQMLSNDLSAFLARQIYPMYQKAQRSRWQTENESETGRWRPLSAEYLKVKKKRYAGYPGRGSKKIIATSKLVTAAIGEGPGLSKMITKNQIRLSIDMRQIPYAKNVANEFPIMEFGKKTQDTMKSAMQSYIKKRLTS